MPKRSPCEIAAGYDRDARRRLAYAKRRAFEHCVEKGFIKYVKRKYRGSSIPSDNILITEVFGEKFPPYPRAL